MRKLFWLLLLSPLIILFVAWYDKFTVKEQSQNKTSVISTIPFVSPSIYSTSPKKLLFVPYWGFANDKIDLSNFDSYIYFGIAANENGIDKNDQGFLNLSRFISLFKLSNNLLAVRMIDNSINFKILDDTYSQEKIINEAIQIAKDNNFKGIVLDFEVQALPFESFTNKITKFVTIFSKTSKKSSLQFYTAIYGDVFYRGRPFDVKNIQKVSDGIFIMAYDFHKAKGNPGPNFPLALKDTYGYDFKQMVNDFIGVVPPSKLSIVFGMFGYDWTIDEEGRSKGSADALTLTEIKKRFVDKCDYKDCQILRDKDLFETKITYKDDQSESHILWYEDEVSVKEKLKYAFSKNITSSIYWAYSYF